MARWETQLLLLQLFPIVEFGVGRSFYWSHWVKRRGDAVLSHAPRSEALYRVLSSNSSLQEPGYEQGEQAEW